MMRRTVTRPEIRVGSHWLSGIFPYWGSLRTQTRGNGDWQASWTVILRHGQRHPAIRHGAPVEVHLGPERVFAGTLTEPNWDSGEMVAIGACREGENTPALTGGGLATTKPNTAVDAAISRGVLSWTRVSNFGTTPVGEDDDQSGLYTVQSILDAWAEENLSGWRVDRDRRLIIDTPDETNPKWFVVPGSGELGQADDERVDRIFVRYVSSSNGRLATASYPAFSVAGGVEQTMDITDRGRMNSTKATNIARAEWNKLQGRSGWTNGLSLTSGQVATKGGVPANLALIKAGDTIRLLGVPDPRGLAANLDVVIGDTEYDWEEDTIQVNPVGLAARDEETVLEQAQEIAASAAKKADKTAAAIIGGAPHAERSGSANQSIPNDTLTTVNIGQSVVPERGGLTFDGVTDTWTVGKAGRYIVSAFVPFVANTTGRRFVAILRNGAQVQYSNVSAANAGEAAIEVTYVADLAAGDTIKFEVRQNSGGGLQITTFRRFTISGLVG